LAGQDPARGGGLHRGLPLCRGGWPPGRSLNRTSFSWTTVFSIFNCTGTWTWCCWMHSHPSATVFPAPGTLTRTPHGPGRGPEPHPDPVRPGVHQAQLTAIRAAFPDHTVLTAAIIPVGGLGLPRGQAEAPAALRHRALMALPVWPARKSLPPPCRNWGWI